MSSTDQGSNNDDAIRSRVAQLHAHLQAVFDDLQAIGSLDAMSSRQRRKLQHAREDMEATLRTMEAAIAHAAGADDTHQ
jgi:hypothetical protein